MKVVGKEIIRVGSSLSHPVDLNQCFNDGDYFLHYFGDCTGLMPRPDGEGGITAQWDFLNVVNWFFSFVSTEFLLPSWNGFMNGLNSGINFILTDIIPPTIGGMWDAATSAFDPLISIGRHVAQGSTGGLINGLQTIVGPVTNALSSGATGGIFDVFTTFSDALAGQQNNLSGIVQAIVNQFGRLPNSLEDVSELFTNFIPPALTDVADRIGTVLKSEYRNTPPCDWLKYFMFDNPVVPYVYGAIPELGPTALTFFQTACYTTYTEGFFENFSYPIATIGIPWAQPTTPLPTVTSVKMPSPQEIVDYLKSVTFTKVLDGITQTKLFQNALAFWQNTVTPIFTGRTPERVTPNDDFIKDLQDSVVHVSRRVRKRFRHCSGEDCCSVEELITGHCHV